jgi:ATP synthase protein I
MGFLIKLLEKSHQDVQRLDKRLKHPAKLVGMLFYGGTLGLLFVVPVVGGAYLGRWLDTLASGYSVRGTISLILLGIAVGGYNVFRFLQEKT